MDINLSSQIKSQNIVFACRAKFFPIQRYFSACVFAFDFGLAKGCEMLDDLARFHAS